MLDRIEITGAGARVLGVVTAIVICLVDLLLHLPLHRASGRLGSVKALLPARSVSEPLDLNALDQRLLGLVGLTVVVS